MSRRGEAELGEDIGSDATFGVRVVEAPSKRVVGLQASRRQVERPNGALLVYAEHTFALARLITADYPWSEAVYAVLLDEEGRRGSEVLRVTDAEATALDAVPRGETWGPPGYPFVFAAAASEDGRRAVVAWFDQRVDREGIYVRSLAIARD